MVNVKFGIGNRLLKIARWYAYIRLCINLILSITFIVLSYVDESGSINWSYFWAGIGCALEIIWIWIFEQFLLGFGLIVCNSAHELSQKKVVTYLDYKEAKRAYSYKKITQYEMDNIEKEYAKNDSGYID